MVKVAARSDDLIAKRTLRSDSAQTRGRRRGDWVPSRQLGRQPGATEERLCPNTGEKEGGLGPLSSIREAVARAGTSASLLPTCGLQERRPDCAAIVKVAPKGQVGNPDRKPVSVSEIFRRNKEAVIYPTASRREPERAGASGRSERPERASGASARSEPTGSGAGGGVTEGVWVCMGLEIISGAACGP